MGISIAEVMSEHFMNTQEVLLFTVNMSDGSYDITPTPLAKKMFDLNRNPVSQLIENERIHSSDRVLVRQLCMDLYDYSGLGISDTKFNINFRYDLEGDGGVYTWLSMTVILPANMKNDPIPLIYISVMNKSELLTKSIVESFTNDKHPSVFNNNVQHLINTDDGRLLVFIQFDIEKFKLINAKYGEEKGNEILNFISNGLDAVCTEEQVHIRLTADVFMVASLFEKPEDIQRFISKVENRLGSCGDITYRLIFGVNIVTDRSLPLRKMGDRAAMARQSIKGNALTNVGYYSDQESSLFSRKYIEDRMYYALEHGEFIMYLQPKYSIRQEKIIGAEALVRWLHPERGLISPMEFIPIFEQNGFIIKLDEYMWEQACRSIRRWIDTNTEPVPISVNISRVHLSDNKFISVLNDLVKKYDIPKHLIETEITETYENSNSEVIINELKKNGYTLLMDDFGSGYSSLNMLKNTPFDIIKIDRDFFSEFMLSERGKKIIHHTISMSRDIGLGLVAEGVETKEQAEFLSSCGCDTAQGYYYSKPMPLDDFEKLAF